MKSILQGIALLSAAALIAGCDSSSGGGSAAVGVTPPASQASVSGAAVKGLIDGATVTITDANGTQIGSSTVINGTYEMVFDPATGNAAPYTVSITGGETLCDYVNPDASGNDCATGQAANPFVAFGQSYALDATFTLSGAVAAQITGTNLENTMNASPATDIALKKAIEKATAAGGSISEASINEANLALSGLVQAITGIDLGGLDVSQIAAADLTASGAVTSTDAQLAVAALASGVIGSQAAGETLAQTITRLASLFTIDADGNVTGTGTALGAFADAVSRGLAVAAVRRPTGGIQTALLNANANSALFKSFGNNAVKIPPVSPPGTNNDVALTRAFVGKLASVIGQLVSSTGAEGFGGQTNASATEAFANELDAVAAVSSTNATTAFNKLDAALKAAATELASATAGTTSVNAAETGEGAVDDGVTFTVTKETDGTLTATGVTAVWPISATAAGRVSLTADTASSTSTGFSLPAVTLTTTTGSTTLQTFTGSASVATDSTDGTEDLALAGTITGQTAGVSYTIDATVSDLTSADQGTYSVAFGFTSPTANNVSVTFSGTIGAAAQTYVITAPAGSINGTVTRSATADTIVLTDASGVALTLTNTNGNLDADGNGLIGGFIVGTNTAATATLSTAGVVTYTDGSIQALPAIIFPE